MSQWIVLMVPRAFDAKRLAEAMPERLVLSVSGTGEIVVRGEESGGVEIGELAPRAEAMADYSGNALLPPAFRSLVPELRFFRIRYGEWKAARSFLEQMLDGWREDLADLWIDDDHGEIWNGRRLHHRLVSDPHWDWRYEKIWYLTWLSRDEVSFSELAEWITAREPERSEIDAEHREIRVAAPTGEPGVDAAGITLYALDTDPASPEDPVLFDLLQEAFSRSVLGSSCFILRYGDHELAKRVLKICLEGLRARAGRVQIDLDQGSTLSGSDALERLRREPDWDWR